MSRNKEDNQKSTLDIIGPAQYRKYINYTSIYEHSCHNVGPIRPNHCLIKWTKVLVVTLFIIFLLLFGLSIHELHKFRVNYLFICDKTNNSSHAFNCLITDNFKSETQISLPSEYRVYVNKSDKINSSGFHTSRFSSKYKYINITTTDMGITAYLEIISNSSYPGDVPLVKIDFNYWSENTLEVKIYDPLHHRYEPPLPKLPSMGSSAAKNTKYAVDCDKENFGFNIMRKSNRKIIFNTKDFGEFIFSDQFLQISSKLPSDHLYGLGQRRNKFKLDMNWNKIVLFNHDQPPKDGTNLYGSHPFYLAMEGEHGSSNGVLLLNSNAMEIELSPTPAITYRTTGGILDFFFFMGPSPADVIRQYTQLVGRPFLPPYWSLGFHLCRFGYKTLNTTIEVWNRTRSSRIPFDTQWNDLDYMENGNDFTYDKERFEGLPEFVNHLHEVGMHYMVLVDPGLSAGELPGTYLPYDEGIAKGVFISDMSGYKPFVGKVWNKESTVWVDFLKPSAVQYWLDQLRSQHKMFEFDGAWIDMNDPANFLDGTKSGCPNSTWDYPPYMPAVAGHHLYYRTLCMSAKHHNGIPHYNVHNIYGLAEAVITSYAMQQIRGKRPFVISRSSFPGLGHYAGVWTGDIYSSWDDMAHSIDDMLSFSLFGIPMSGADICGFNGNATVQLCQRWSQLGAFYPFARNHNSDLSTDQDPVSLGPEVVESARKALLVRYTLLPYLYTLFWNAHTHGDTVVRPLFFEFPEVEDLYSQDAEFFWGPALLIAPVLKEETVNLTLHLPPGTWYNYYTYQKITSDSKVLISIDAPLDTIPLMLRAGYIIPTQGPELTTTLSRSNPIDLLVVLDDAGKATGQLFWDDGDSLDFTDGVYNLINFITSDTKLSSEVQQWRFITTLILGKVTIIGVQSVSMVNLNGEPVPFSFKSEVLKVENLNVDLGINFELSWF